MQWRFRRYHLYLEYNKLIASMKYVGLCVAVILPLLVAFTSADDCEQENIELKKEMELLSEKIGDQQQELDNCKSNLERLQSMEIDLNKSNEELQDEVSRLEQQLANCKD